MVRHVDHNFGRVRAAFAELAATHPEIVEAMKKQYDAGFTNVCARWQDVQFSTGAQYWSRLKLQLRGENP